MVETHQAISTMNVPCHQDYHIIMSYASWHQGHHQGYHQVMSSASSNNQLDHMSSSCTSSSQLDQSPQELYHRHHQVINWTIGSTIRYMAPPSTGIIKASPIRLYLHHLGSTTSNRLHLHHQNQSNHQGTIINSLTIQGTIRVINISSRLQ